MPRTYFAYLIAKDVLSTGDRYWHSAHGLSLADAALIGQTMYRIETAAGYEVAEASVNPDDETLT